MKKKIKINPTFDVDKLVSLSQKSMKNVIGGADATFPGGTLPPETNYSVGCDRLTGTCGRISGS
ncbi:MULTISPECIES: hypothetical protein [Sphingobacterium]|uniref:hypothetical protein n=1 Tax=Sphingobacterium TaxID=28453 RepID=UPI0008A15658|nr:MULTISPECIES: hypothetical protein [Sphingobacterium]OFV10467.1 hypothetical protein HMPREF3127_21345 [Sphingobacterium sp. HMSC13C05]